MDIVAAVREAVVAEEEEAAVRETDTAAPAAAVEDVFRAEEATELVAEWEVEAILAAAALAAV